jgi:hypothetical protein
MSMNEIELRILKDRNHLTDVIENAKEIINSSKVNSSEEFDLPRWANETVKKIE